MARHPFGGTVWDWVMARHQSSPLAPVVAALQVTRISFFTAESGGAAVLDLQDSAGNAVVAVDTDENGFLPTFFGPDNVTTLWADAGTGDRRLMVARDSMGPEGQKGNKGDTGNTGAAGGSDAAQAGWINDSASATRAALSATIAAQAAPLDFVTDSYAIQRLDRLALTKARTKGDLATAAYADATELAKDWADLTGWQAAANAQVSGNRLYALNGNNPGGALKGFSVGAAEVAHITGLIYWKAGSTTAPIYVGLDFGAVDHVPAANSPDGMFIGLNSGGVRTTFPGSNMAAAFSADQAVGSNPAVDTTYQYAIDVNTNFISFALRRLGDSADLYSAYVSRATLATAGKSIGNVSLFLQDTRGTSGNAFGPVVAVKSRQNTRTKVMGGQTVEGADHRYISTAPGPGLDPWRVQLPATYDARVPSPVVIYHHQSLTGNANTAWTEARMQPVTDALADAGFILATANDGGDRWGNQASIDNYRALYEHVRDRYHTGPLFLLGISMGLMPVLNALVRRDLPTPAALAGVGGVYNLDDLFANNTGSYAAGIRTAYGVAANGSDYDAKTAGWNPADRIGREFRGVPMRLYTSTGDTNVPKASNSDALAAKVLPYTSEATVVLGSGGHLDISQFQAADLTAFFSKYA